VKFIIGPVGSPPALGVISVTNPAKVIALTNGYAPQILKNDTRIPTISASTPTNIEFGPPLIKWLKDNVPEIKKVGILAPNDAVGQSVAGALAEDTAKQGSRCARSVRARHQGVHAADPRMMAQKVDAFEFDGNSPGRRRPDAEADRQAGFKGRVMQSAVQHRMRSSRLPVRRPRLPVQRHIHWDTPAGVQAAPHLREEIRQGHHQSVHAGLLHTVSCSWMPSSARTSIDTANDARRPRPMNGFDAGIYGPVKWTGKESYGVNRQLMLPYISPR